MIPGSNLLAAALTLIASQPVRYYAFSARTTNAAGQFVPGFAPGVTITKGSVQAVPLDRYEQLGLDRKKVYAAWYAPVHATGVSPARSGDEFEFGGGRYQIVGETDWFVQDGWVGVIGVKIGPATGVP